jgi:hypothetical protein
MKSSPKWTSEGNQMVLCTRHSGLITTTTILSYGVPYHFVRLLTIVLINQWYVDRMTYGSRLLDSSIYSERLRYLYFFYQLTLTVSETQRKPTFRRPSSSLRSAQRPKEIKSSYGWRKRFWWDRLTIDRENRGECMFVQKLDKSPKSVF